MTCIKHECRVQADGASAEHLVEQDKDAMACYFKIKKSAKE